MASSGKLMESLFMCLVSILFLANVSQVMEEPYLRRGPRQLLRSGAPKKHLLVAAKWNHDCTVPCEDRHTWYFEKVNLEVPKHDKVSLKSSANNSCKGLLLQNFPTLMSSPGRENCLTPSWGQTAPASFNQINVQIILREKHGILHYTSVCIYLYLHITYIYIYIEQPGSFCSVLAHKTWKIGIVHAKLFDPSIQPQQLAVFPPQCCPWDVFLRRAQGRDHKHPDHWEICSQMKKDQGLKM